MLCRIGRIEVWRILEINAPFLTPEDMFPDAGDDLVSIINRLEPGLICSSSGRIILPVQGFLLKTPRHTILVDSCVGNDKTNNHFPDWHHRTENRFLAALGAAGASVDDVDYVLCTHLHVDHVGWNTRLVDGRWVPTFPNARYLLPSADDALYRNAEAAFYHESVLPVIAAGQDEMVGPDHQLGDCITLLPTPGHTPGHVSVLLDSDGERAIITGDALHITPQCWHPEWEFVFDTDGSKAVASRRWLLEQAAENQWHVLGTHFTLPSVGLVNSGNGAFCWCGT